VPLIQHSLGLLQTAGVGTVVINLHHHPDSIRRAVASCTQKTLFSHEPRTLGTAGALAKVRELLGQSTFILVNGKIYFEEDLGKVLNFHRASGALVTLVLVPHGSGDPFSPVLVDGANQVTGFLRAGGVPESDREQESRRFTFTGIHVIEPEVLKFIPEGVSDIVLDVYQLLIRKGYPIQAFISERYWCECSTPERYLANSMAALRHRGALNLLHSSLEAHCCGVIAGSGVTAPRSCTLDNCVLWNNIDIGADARLENVVIADNLGPLPEHLEVSNSVILPSTPVVLANAPASARVHREFVVWPIASAVSERMSAER
jgi:NDP-sugar pyrophosphorylase family protein